MSEKRKARGKERFDAYWEALSGDDPEIDEISSEYSSEYSILECDQCGKTYQRQIEYFFAKNIGQHTRYRCRSCISREVRKVRSQADEGKRCQLCRANFKPYTLKFGRRIDFTQEWFAEVGLKGGFEEHLDDYYCSRCKEKLLSMKTLDEQIERRKELGTYVEEFPPVLHFPRLFRDKKRRARQLLCRIEALCKYGGRETDLEPVYEAIEAVYEILIGEKPTE